MKLLQEIKERAQQNPQRIVLPEGTEPRTLEAANSVLRDKVAKLILIGNPAEINRLAEEKGYTYIKEATIVDPENNPNLEKYATLLAELRKSKGMTIEEATRLAKDPLYLACLMIKSGDADGELAGAQNTTGNVLRPALQIVKTKPGMTCVSGAMMLFTKTPQYGEDGLLMVADVAVMPNPTAEELAQIAVATGETMRAIANKEPRIAMLSFSTKGSAKHEMVDKVVVATKMAQEKAPDMMIEGELQADGLQTFTDLLLENNVSYRAMQLANPRLPTTRLAPGTPYCAPPAYSRRLCPRGSRSYAMGVGESLDTLVETEGLSPALLLAANPTLAPGDFVPGRVICLP